MSDENVRRRWLFVVGGMCAFAVGALASREFSPARRSDRMCLEIQLSHAKLKEAVRESQREIAAKDRLIADLQDQLAQRSAPAAAPSAVVAAPSVAGETPSTAQEVSAAETRADFWAEETTRWVESSFALKPDERELLKRRLREASLAGSADLQSVYQDALGAERAAELKRQELEEEATEQRESIEQEVFTLARKLALTGEQEVFARDALLEVQEVLRPIEARMKVAQERAMQLHRAPKEDGNAELFNIYRQMQELRKNAVEQRREYLVTKLRESLNDQQLNGLLEYESARADEAR
ncbi:MAG: hypothetical protein IT290_07950 [Deltaproteobacteria bacterium]|nr:hypothetical protein [Deltaproteobacteria bacterium]